MNMQPDETLLKELVERILAVVHPIRIILFGSAARGELKPDSDLDVLVVVPDDAKCRDISGDIYMNLIGFDLPVDVIVVTESNLERYGQKIGLVYRPALREGREIYAA